LAPESAFVGPAFFCYNIAMVKLEHAEYWKRGQEFLNVRYPLIAGAMTWISDAQLVRSVSDAGAF